MTMTLEELKAEIQRLDRLIDHARDIWNSPDHRGESGPVVERWTEKLAQLESDRQELLARLTTEDRMFLRDEITREIEEQFVLSQTAQSKSEKDEAQAEIHRLQQRWARISKFGGIVPTEVNGRDLLDEITRTLLKFVTVSKEAARILALWILHTHAIPYWVFYHTSRLLIWSKEPEAGKSTLANVFSHLVHNPLPSGGVTGDGLLTLLKEHNSPPPAVAGQWTSVGGPAAAEKPTLLIDEADNIMQTQKLRRILNTGHHWCGAIQEKNRRTDLMELIGTFAALALFEIDEAERASPSMRSYRPLKTRSIEIELKLGSEDPKHDADPSDELFNSLGTELHPKIKTWVEAHIDEIGETYRRLKKEIKKEGLNRVIRPRARDNWLPLMAIAEVAGGHWPETVRELCVKFAPHRAEHAFFAAHPVVAERVEQTDEQELMAEEAQDAKNELRFAENGGKVAVAKLRIMRALRHRSPQSRCDLRLAGCKNIPGPIFNQALKELVAEGQAVPLGKAPSGGKPKDMYGIANHPGVASVH